MSGKKPQAAFSQYRFAGDFRFLYKQALNSNIILYYRNQARNN
jgi:hypothetical protein